MANDGTKDAARAASRLTERLPEALSGLAGLATNLWWSWQPGGPGLFRDLDADGWAECNERPFELLQKVAPERLEQAAADGGYLERLAGLTAAMTEDLSRPVAPEAEFLGGTVAFFCAEFAVHRSLPIYAGGLGVLAGDILKESSDRALPVAGVGLLYHQGYFRQAIDRTGWQQESWPSTDPEATGAALITGEDGEPLTVSVPLAGREVHMQVWRASVGRVPLFLLDSRRAENAPQDQDITARLYAADHRLRLEQYALLAVGGIRALQAVGIDPAVVHLNEGHAALAPLELARALFAAGRPFDQAFDEARHRTVFTTHTPVAAGNETYSERELHESLEDLLAQLDPDGRHIVELGRSPYGDEDRTVGITPIGLRVSRAANAVSRLHGEVARAMWSPLFPDLPVSEVPIAHVTNGVHLPTWMAPPMQELLDRHLPRGWRSAAHDLAVWEGVEAIPDEELWGVRTQLRRALVDYLRDSAVAKQSFGDDRWAPNDMAADAFDPRRLTIGFARRVAMYKRLHLLFREPQRLKAIADGGDGVQFVLAGKAHPADDEAKRLLQRMFELGWVGDASPRILFVEDYDMSVAAQLVAGCDVWVNLPRPPLEASGTSGMKAGMNGGLNCSVLDGWWAEAYDGTNGWALGADPTLDLDEQDTADAAALYDLLEHDVAPAFLDRDDAGVPRAWVARIKASLRTVGPGFSAGRMMRDYLTTVYPPAPGAD